MKTLTEAVDILANNMRDDALAGDDNLHSDRELSLVATIYGITFAQLCTRVMAKLRYLSKIKG